MEKILSELRVINTSLNSEMKRVEDKVDTKFTMVIWAIGLLMTVIIALKFIK